VAVDFGAGAAQAAVPTTVRSVGADRICDMPARFHGLLTATAFATKRWWRIAAIVAVLSFLVRWPASA
jgi:hypothetical protein